MQVEELQWELFRQLLQFVPSSSGELQRRVWFFYAGFFSTWCARIEGRTGVWHRQAISDNSMLVSVYCVLLRILSEGLGTGN